MKIVVSVALPLAGTKEFFGKEILDNLKNWSIKNLSNNLIYAYEVAINCYEKENLWD